MGEGLACLAAEIPGSDVFGSRMLMCKSEVQNTNTINMMLSPPPIESSSAPNR